MKAKFKEATWRKSDKIQKNDTKKAMFFRNMQVVRRAHTRKLKAHINVPSKNTFCTYMYFFITTGWRKKTGLVTFGFGI